MSSSTPTRPGSRARTIEPALIAERSFSLPESWLRGILAGAEGVFGPWIAVIVPAIAVYIATASAPDLGSASWWEAARLGTGVWAVAHGAALEIGDATISLMPLGITLMAFFLSAAAIRRARLATWGGVAFAVGTYTAGAAILVKFAATPGGNRAIWGALIIATLAALWGVRGQRPRAPERLRDAGDRLKQAWVERVEARDHRGLGALGAATLRAAWATTGRALASIGALATIGVALAIIFGMPLVLAVHSELEMDVISAIVVVGGQILLLPTLAIWAAAYLSGAGFALGEGTLYSPSEVLSAPLPAVPILGALPNPENPPLPFLGFTLVAVGLLAGWILHHQLRGHVDGEPHPLASLAAVVLTGGLVVGIATLAALLASGGFGPGRFASGVGPLLGSFALALAWQITAPMLAVVIGAHPATHRGVRAGWEWLQARRASAE